MISRSDMHTYTQEFIDEVNLPSHNKEGVVQELMAKVNLTDEEQAFCDEWLENRVARVREAYQKFPSFDFDCYDKETHYIKDKRCKFLGFSKLLRSPVKKHGDEAAQCRVLHSRGYSTQMISNMTKFPHDAIERHIEEGKNEESL